jgi:serine O-acetyltransferase
MDGQNRRFDFKDEAGLVVQQLLRDYQGGREIDKIASYREPDRDAIVRVIHELFQIVYPGYYRDPNATQRVFNIDAAISTITDDILINLAEQIEIALRYTDAFHMKSADDVREASQKTAIEFVRRIPRVREFLDTDIQAILDGDPAAYSKSEIILSYPGLSAITVYRLAHELHLLKVPMIPRIMTEHAHSRTGVDIHPGATIGKYFMIDHATGIVVGETTVIGEHVKVYQGVTIGALSTRAGHSLQGKKRHPTIEDNVTIYSGATILGGETVIGHDVVIGGNCFITASIAPNSRVNVKNQEEMLGGK